MAIKAQPARKTARVRRNNPNKCTDNAPPLGDSPAAINLPTQANRAANIDCLRHHTPFSAPALARLCSTDTHHAMHLYLTRYELNHILHDCSLFFKRVTFVGLNKLFYAKSQKSKRIPQDSVNQRFLAKFSRKSTPLYRTCSSKSKLLECNVGVSSPRPRKKNTPGIYR